MTHTQRNGIGARREREVLEAGEQEHEADDETDRPDRGLVELEDRHRDDDPADPGDERQPPVAREVPCQRAQPDPPAGVPASPCTTCSLMGSSWGRTSPAGDSRCMPTHRDRAARFGDRSSPGLRDPASAFVRLARRPGQADLDDHEAAVVLLLRVSTTSSATGTLNWSPPVRTRASRRWSASRRCPPAAPPPVARQALLVLEIGHIGPRGRIGATVGKPQGRAPACDRASRSSRDRARPRRRRHRGPDRGPERGRRYAEEPSRAWLRMPGPRAHGHRRERRPQRWRHRGESEIRSLTSSPPMVPHGPRRSPMVFRRPQTHGLTETRPAHGDEKAPPLAGLF